MLRFSFIRAALRAILRPFGKTVARDYIGWWYVDGDKINRRLIPCGWRIAGINDKDMTSPLDRLLRSSGNFDV